MPSASMTSFAAAPELKELFWQEAGRNRALPLLGAFSVFLGDLPPLPTIIVDEHDNLWIACNQSDEVMVLEPTQGRVIAKLGDFGGIDEDGAPIGFLWANSLVFHGDDVLVTNLSADIGATASNLRTVDGPWAAEVKLHTVSKIKKRLPGVPE
jgi:hypothetical protein